METAHVEHSSYTPMCVGQLLRVKSFDYRTRAYMWCRFRFHCPERKCDAEFLLIFVCLHTIFNLDLAYVSCVDQKPARAHTHARALLTTATNKCTLMLRVKMVSGVYVFNKEMSSYFVHLLFPRSNWSTQSLGFMGTEQRVLRLEFAFLLHRERTTNGTGKNIVLHFRALSSVHFFIAASLSLFSPRVLLHFHFAARHYLNRNTKKKRDAIVDSVTHFLSAKNACSNFDNMIRII